MQQCLKQSTTHHEPTIKPEPSTINNSHKSWQWTAAEHGQHSWKSHPWKEYLLLHPQAKYPRICHANHASQSSSERAQISRTHPARAAIVCLDVHWACSCAKWRKLGLFQFTELKIPSYCQWWTLFTYAYMCNISALFDLFGQPLEILALRSIPSKNGLSMWQQNLRSRANVWWDQTTDALVSMCSCRCHRRGLATQARQQWSLWGATTARMMHEQAWQELPTCRPWESATDIWECSKWAQNIPHPKVGCQKIQQTRITCPRTLQPWSSWKKSSRHVCQADVFDDLYASSQPRLFLCRLHILQIACKWHTMCALHYLSCFHDPHETQPSNKYATERIERDNKNIQK